VGKVISLEFKRSFVVVTRRDELVREGCGASAEGLAADSVVVGDGTTVDVLGREGGTGTALELVEAAGRRPLLLGDVALGILFEDVAPPLGAIGTARPLGELLDLGSTLGFNGRAGKAFRGVG
jgi:hypothetical protein